MGNNAQRPGPVTINGHPVRLVRAQQQLSIN
jgi:hypothetical protein